ncbi:MAG: hypothetical protein L7S72_08995 [Flavobacteriales bacterium]|nr:hypothetical protein [Flavobacteriales bacterium]
MSKKDNVVRIGHNSGSFTEEAIQKLKDENWYLQDCIVEAIYTITKLIYGSDKLSSELKDLKNAKNNWDRSTHANKAIKTNGHLQKDLDVFKHVVYALDNKKDLYQHPQKHHTLNLGGEKGNFGMFFANEEKNLQEIVNKASNEWFKEVDKDE